MALQTDEYRLQALITRALRAIKASDWSGACLDLTNAMAISPGLQEVHALLAKVVSQTQPIWALRLLDAFLDKFPDSPTLWPLYWSLKHFQVSQACSAERPSQASGAVDATDFIERSPFERLPYVTEGAELRAILAFLVHQPKAPRFLGVCQYDAQTSVVSGWALDRSAPNTPCELVIQSGSARGQLVADAPSMLLEAAGLSAQVGGFKIKLAKLSDALDLSFTDGTALLGSPLAAVTPISPVYAASTNQHPLAGEGGARSCLQGCVDVLVPVYNSAAQTLVCLMSLINAQPRNRTPYEIIVLDDASQDPALVACLGDLARSGRITWIKRPSNLGFIRNVNRGMTLHTDRDVVWLNSDARVTGNWLDRLNQVAYLSPRIASVTPFSNNGELMSFPAMRQAYPMPSLAAQQSFDDLLVDLDLPAREIVVGCGFCFYVKRSALDDVGALDEITLIRGYGEETDWCFRAQSLGWRHMGATNVFVAHAGGLSFGGSKRWLASRNNAVIKRRYPFATQAYERFVSSDSLQDARQTVQRHRLGQITRENLIVDFDVDLSITPVVGSPKSAGADEIWMGYSRVGVDLKVTLLIGDVDPAIVMHYRLPGGTKQLVQDLASLQVKTFEPRQLNAFGERVAASAQAALPTVLAACFEGLKISRACPQQSQDTIASGKRPSRELSTVSNTELSATQEMPSTLLGSLEDSFGLIDDDLTDPLIAKQWLSWIKGVAPDSYLMKTRRPFGYLLVLQDTPAAREMQKTGLVSLVFLPKGLGREQWLTLLGVSYLVSGFSDTADASEGTGRSDVCNSFREVLGDSEGVCLPRVSAKRWLKAIQGLSTALPSAMQKGSATGLSRSKGKAKSSMQKVNPKANPNVSTNAEDLTARFSRLGFEFI